MTMPQDFAKAVHALRKLAETDDKSFGLALLVTAGYGVLTVAKLQQTLTSPARRAKFINNPKLHAYLNHDLTCAILTFSPPNTFSASRLVSIDAEGKIQIDGPDRVNVTVPSGTYFFAYTREDSTSAFKLTDFTREMFPLLNLKLLPELRTIIN